MMIVGVGFDALGLQNQIDQSEGGRPIKLFLPFPSQPARFRRSWEVARRLQRQRPETFEVYRCHPNDPADAFDRIVSLTHGGAETADLAPFGPKPMSLAMCIYASLTEAQVFYTQPSSDRPDYSIGVSQLNGHAEIYAYWIRLNGTNAYKL